MLFSRAGGAVAASYAEEQAGSSGFVVSQCLVVLVAEFYSDNYLVDFVVNYVLHFAPAAMQFTTKFTK